MSYSFAGILTLLLLVRIACNWAQLVMPNSLPVPFPMDNDLVINKNCPLSDDAAHPVMLPYSYDCRKYYSCLNGVAYLLTCPDGLHWSMSSYRCDYPSVAMCTQIQSTEGFPNDLPVKPLYGYHAFTGDCSKYYQYRLLQCPPGQHWSSQLERCDLPKFSACNDGGAMPPPVTPPSLTPPTAATPPPTNSYPIVNFTNPAPSTEWDRLCSDVGGAKYIHFPGDCHRFIQCNGIAFVHTCPANLYWNSELQTCDRYCK